MNSWDLCILLKSKGLLVSHLPMSTGGSIVVSSHNRLSLLTAYPAWTAATYEADCKKQ